MSLYRGVCVGMSSGTVWFYNKHMQIESNPTRGSLNKTWERGQKPASTTVTLHIHNHFLMWSGGMFRKVTFSGLVPLGCRQKCVCRQKLAPYTHFKFRETEKEFFAEISTLRGPGWTPSAGMSLSVFSYRPRHKDSPAPRKCAVVWNKYVRTATI